MYKPPYSVTPEMLNSIATIAEKIGIANGKYLVKPNPVLRKQNKIKTIHASLAIEGNTLTEQQITALLENKRVMGPKKDVQEVQNAIKVYGNISQYNFKIEKHFLKAHAHLMQNLIPHAGAYRKESVGIAKGTQIKHIAPSYKVIPGLMKDLFSYLKRSKEHVLIKSCVFHYELEFIHPFTDGNGRMGRLWQTLILIKSYPIFEYLPVETIIREKQKAYYQALAKSDAAGNCNAFISFMLNIFNIILAGLIETKVTKPDTQSMVELFLEQAGNTFSRKNYLNFFNTISTATASRDLAYAVENKLVFKQGLKNKTIYHKNEN